MMRTHSNHTKLTITAITLFFLLGAKTHALDMQDFINGRAHSLTEDCSDSSKELSLSSVHSLVATACTLNSLNMTERKNLEISEGENHFHDWDIINSEEGFIVQGYCSKRVIMRNGQVSQVLEGQKIDLSFLAHDMKKCDPVIKGRIGPRSVRFQFTDGKDVMLSDNSTYHNSKRVLTRLDIGVDFPMDWLKFTFTSPWMVAGNTPENRELGLGNRRGLDFNTVRLHMAGSRSLTAALAMRWDFLISGEPSENSSGGSKNLLIKIANSTDSLSAGFESQEMSVTSNVAQNIFYADGFGIDPMTQKQEAYVTKMRGCSDLIFDGTLFKMSALNVDRCQSRIHRFTL